MSSPLLLSCPIEYSSDTVFPPASRVCSFLRLPLVTRTLSAAIHPIVSLKPSDSFRSGKKERKKDALVLYSIFVLGFYDVSVFLGFFAPVENTVCTVATGYNEPRYSERKNCDWSVKLLSGDAIG